MKFNIFKKKKRKIVELDFALKMTLQDFLVNIANNNNNNKMNANER